MKSKKKSGAKTHQTFNDELLADKSIEETVFSYILDIPEKSEYMRKVIHYYEPQDENQKSLKVNEVTFSTFTIWLKHALNDGKVYFSYFDGNKLYVKYKKYDEFYMYEFTLTNRAINNLEFLNFLRQLPQEQPNYRELIMSEKYTQLLIDAYYNNIPPTFEHQKELDEFIIFFNNKKHILADNKYKKFPKIFIKILSCRVSHKINALIKESQRMLDASTLEKAKVQGTKKPIFQKKDEFIDNIKKDIIRINEFRYEGFEEHKKLLCRLAALYLKAKEQNVNGTPYNLFLENGSLMDSLITIEKSINSAIAENQQLKTNADILAEIAALAGVSIEEILEEDNISQVEESTSFTTHKIIQDGGVAKMKIKKQ